MGDDEFKLTGQENEQVPQDLEGVFRDAQGEENKANERIQHDLDGALAVGERVGEEAGTYIQDIQRNIGEVREAEAAFEARTERLNSPYVLSPDLEKVLKVSRVLKKPLILEGEPGTGKTSLAYALAGHEDLPIIHAQCKSTTSAKELLYSFDVVRRLQDAQLGLDVSDLNKYVRLGPLGKAFASEEQVILLIDEVDKAKRDFTNDLLHELDQMAFFIDETGEEVAAKQRPIVIITSNHERDLPEPVLRRSVYHFIDFPPVEQMTEIVKAHIPDVNERLLESATNRFYEIRGVDSLQKKPSTSEMLDWIRVLQAFGVEEVGEDTPFPETLLKYKEDTEVISKRTERDRDIERQKKEGTPDVVLAALNGERVIRLKDDYQVEPKLLAFLATQGIDFVTERSSYEGVKRDFEIRGEGVHRVGPMTFAFVPNSSGEQVYELLKSNDFVASEFVPTKEPAEFAKVRESNDLYLEGEDNEGRRIYRMKDGRVVREQRFENSKEKSDEYDDDGEETSLGASTLAKLRDTKLFPEDDDN